MAPRARWSVVVLPPAPYPIRGPGASFFSIGFDRFVGQVNSNKVAPLPSPPLRSAALPRAMGLLSCCFGGSPAVAPALANAAGGTSRSASVTGSSGNLSRASFAGGSFWPQTMSVLPPAETLISLLSGAQQIELQSAFRQFDLNGNGTMCARHLGCPTTNHKWPRGADLSSPIGSRPRALVLRSDSKELKSVMARLGHPMTDSQARGAHRPTASWAIAPASPLIAHSPSLPHHRASAPRVRPSVAAPAKSRASSVAAPPPFARRLRRRPPAVLLASPPQLTVVRACAGG
jgi:hypothetical protein